MNLYRLEVTFLLCGFFSAIAGVVLLMLAIFSSRPDEPEAGKSAKSAATQMLLFATVCVIGQRALHC